MVNRQLKSLYLPMQLFSNWVVGMTVLVLGTRFFANFLSWFGNEFLIYNSEILNIIPLMVFWGIVVFAILGIIGLNIRWEKLEA